MKRILLILPLIFVVLSCSSSESTEEIPLVEKVSDSGRIFSLEDFKILGFKKSKEYKVDDLPGATSAYYGFIKNKLDPEDDKIDYEIRFYPSHADAVQQGTKYAENIVGVDGCVSKDCALWKADLKQRVLLAELGVMNFHAGSSKVIPKYYNYVIHGNMILFCSGWEEEDAMQRCSKVINDLTSSE